MYHGGRKPETPEEGQAHMQNWKQWIEDLGDRVVNPGTPLPKSKTITRNEVVDGGGANPVNGYMIIKAESLDEAVEIAKSDPFLEMDGSLEVAEMMGM